MKHDEFRVFLSNETKQKGKESYPLSENAIKARLSRAGRIEKELQIDLDKAVEDINNLKNIKKQLKESYKSSTSSTLYNTVTRYYKFIHGEEPELKHRDYLRL